MIRTIDVKQVRDNLKEMCIEVNHFLSVDMDEAVKSAADTEQSPIGKKILNQLQENLKVAGKNMIPICQDTGIAVVFVKLGQDVHFVGGDLNNAINEGVKRGYKEGFLRSSVVNDPLIRENTGNNTPAIIYYEIAAGSDISLTLAPKGFESENTSQIFMLKPSDGIEGIKEAVLNTVKNAGTNACPPMVVGIGIGGTFEKCAIMAKRALTRNVNEHSQIPHVKELEKDLLKQINQSGIGPGGLGGSTTALAVNINTYATHIKGLPLAVNICCHVNRHCVRTI